jgi:transglutaminase-like putative cysteine protease
MDTSNDTSLPLPRLSRFKQLIHGCMVIVMTITSVAPSAHAFAGGPGILSGLAQGTSGSGGNEEEERYLKFFERARVEVAALAGKPDKYGRLPAADQQEAAREKLDDLIDELNDIQSAIDEEFEEVGKLVKSKKLPKTIRARHDAAFASVTAEFDAVRRDIRQVRNERDARKRKSLAEGLYRRLDTQRFQRSQQEFDPAALPNSSLKPDEKNAPRLTEDAYISSGLVGNPIYRVAQAGGYNIASLPGASDPAYLAATDEIVLTDDIRAKATELANEPVRIYEWVRNNVQWAPTWGAIQDASHTLSSQRGNAFDISSLTIALLRAAGYPARYVHGTIDVPEAAFRNWAGGFENINAAMEFASSGGVPLGPVTNAGRITKVRMEHIWVEAAIDFLPSRGTRNRDADTWVAMDPSFKQLLQQQGLDLVQRSGLDAQVVAAEFVDSATVSEAEGWATGADPVVMQSAQSQASAQLQQYIQSNLPGATVADVFGSRTIVQVASNTLPSGLANKVVVTGARYGRLPASLQQRITFAFGKDVVGEPVSPRSFAWSTLNSHLVTLSFRPATAEDDAALRALAPSGEVTDVSQLPTTIPAYLVNVVPELKVDGVVSMSGQPMALGAEMTFVFNPEFAGRGPRSFSYKLPAGSFLSVAVVAGSVNPARVQAASEALTQTRETIQSNNPEAMRALTRDELIMQPFYSGLLSYYSQYTSLGFFSALQNGGHHQLAAGLGSFGYEPKPDYLFGVPRRVRPGGAAMNIPIVNIVGANGEDAGARRRTTLQLGAISSALEHAVPEQLFTSGSNAASAVSAVKALQMAAAAGQRIYEITQVNQVAAISQLSLDVQTVNEIRGAVAAGKTVITHTNPVSVPGWTGAGYVILDPETGSGAWKISGGANGGFVTGLIIGAVLVMAMVLLALSFPFFAAGSLLAVAAAGEAIMVLAATLAGAFSAYFSNQSEAFRECMLVGIATVMLAVAIGAFFMPVLLPALSAAFAILGIAGGVATLLIPTSTLPRCVGG